ncbi:MAG: DUF1572 domain-containing protein [Flavobacteriaceae bacterium]|nr:DUF1572 domain-containing protein [Flavobacteriaceae bacterium]
MLADDLMKIFEKDFNQLINEIDSYKNEENLWILDKEIKNSAGNLCLHLIGNLNHFIGAELGFTDYIRNRELEFSKKNVPKEQLKKQIEDTKQVVIVALSQMNGYDFEKIYPLIVFGTQMTTQFFIIHLSTHLAYHIGQINYHRRMLDN